MAAPHHGTANAISLPLWLYSVQETPEPTERPRWLDSLLSAAAGAALVATAWIFTMARRRRVAG